MAAHFLQRTKSRVSIAQNKSRQDQLPEIWFDLLNINKFGYIQKTYKKVNSKIHQKPITLWTIFQKGCNLEL